CLVEFEDLAGCPLLKLALKRRPVSSAEELPDPKEIREFDSPDLRSKFSVIVKKQRVLASGVIPHGKSAASSRSGASRRGAGAKVISWIRAFAQATRRCRLRAIPPCSILRR